MKSSRRHEEMNGMRGNYKPSFFKVVLDDPSSPLLRRIPPKFVKHFLEDFPYNITLRVCSARSWRIELSRIRCDLFMQGGWEDFIRENCLGDNEMLLFTYQGSMNFLVSIFNKNGVERLHHPPEPCNEIPRGFAQANGSGRKVSCNASKKLMEEIKEESEEEELVGDSWGINLQREEAREAKDASRRKSKRERKSRVETSARTHGGFSTSSSTFPTLTMEMQKSYVQPYGILRIPKSFAAQHLPKRKTTFVLRDAEGESWEVIYIYKQNYQWFAGGWPTFTNDNKLEIGDTCKFKLVAPVEMEVHISRFNQEEDED